MVRKTETDFVKYIKDGDFFNYWFVIEDLVEDMKELIFGYDIDNPDKSLARDIYLKYREFIRQSHILEKKMED